jgi:hypothetical protein
MNWLTAASSTLNLAFEVQGRFYASPAGHACRDELLINRKCTSSKRESSPDAVFVMMNPGASEPLSGEDTAAFEAARHVPAKPDRTQYQVMRLMAHFG